MHGFRRRGGRPEDHHHRGLVREGCRGPVYNWMEAGLDRDGYPVAWIHKAVGQSKMDALIETSAPSILPQWLPSPLRYALASAIIPIGKRFLGPILRMDEAPRVEVHIIKSADPPNGIGEVGVPPVAPAVTNALFRATGKRIRTLPVDPAELLSGA